MHAPEQRMVPVDGAEFCVETIGSVDDPPVLLVAGAAASMDWWDPQWCAGLAAHGLRVVRFDHRDTGRSTTGTPGRPDYGGRALGDDTLALVRHLGPRPVHLVGVSMGGGIAQLLALTHPELLAGATLIATSPVGGVGGLPPSTPAVQAAFSDPAPDPDWTDREAVLEWYVAAERVFAGGAPIDEDGVRTTAGLAWDRSTDPAAAGNHWLVVADGDDAPLDVHDITVPTLVVHGRLDPFFPPAHGVALAGAIPGATLLLVEAMGHGMPPRSSWPVVLSAVAQHVLGGG